MSRRGSTPDSNRGIRLGGVAKLLAVTGNDGHGGVVIKTDGIRSIELSGTALGTYGSQIRSNLPVYLSLLVVMIARVMMGNEAEFVLF